MVDRMTGVQGHTTGGTCVVPQGAMGPIGGTAAVPHVVDDSAKRYSLELVMRTAGMGATEGAAAPQAIVYRGIHLERVAPSADAEERYEASPFGPHFPMRPWIERRSPRHQWCAGGFVPGCVAYSWDTEDALDEARQRAIEYLHFAAVRLEGLGQ